MRDRSISTMEILPKEELLYRIEELMRFLEEEEENGI